MIPEWIVLILAGIGAIVVLYTVTLLPIIVLAFVSSLAHKLLRVSERRLGIETFEDVGEYHEDHPYHARALNALVHVKHYSREWAYAYQNKIERVWNLLKVGQ